MQKLNITILDLLFTTVLLVAGAVIAEITLHGSISDLRSLALFASGIVSTSTILIGYPYRIQQVIFH